MPSLATARQSNTGPNTTDSRFVRRRGSFPPRENSKHDKTDRQNALEQLETLIDQTRASRACFVLIVLETSAALSPHDNRETSGGYFDRLDEIRERASNGRLGLRDLHKTMTGERLLLDGDRLVQFAEKVTTRYCALFGDSRQLRNDLEEFQNEMRSGTLSVRERAVGNLFSLWTRHVQGEAQKLTS